MQPFRFQRRAEKEFKEAIAYFEKQEAGLGSAFEAEFEEAVARIQSNPQIGATHEGTQYRYWVIRRFRYVIFYTVEEGTLWIVAVAHGSRRPAYWKRRKLI